MQITMLLPSARTPKPCESRPCNALAVNAPLTYMNSTNRATKGMGKFQPGEWKDVAELTGNDELKGVHMPVGPLKELGGTNYLWYNEVRQIQ